MLPAEKAADALNKLASLGFGHADAAMIIYFDLKGLAVRQPSNVDVRTAMAQACQLIGYRQEAVAHLLAAEALWSTAGLVTQSRIANLLRALGFAEFALKRAKTLANLPLNQQKPEIVQNNALAAIQFGDLDFLQQVASQERESGYPGYANEVLTAAPIDQWIAHFGPMQMIVSEIVAPYVMNTSFGTPVHPDDGTMFLKSVIDIDGSLIHRFDLDDQVQAALESYAADHITDWPDWWWRYFVEISAAPRHASIPAKARARAAA
jgi:hypothetical protein